MNIIQCRMSRAALGWTLDDLAAASGVSRRTVARFEAGGPVLSMRVQKLREAFEANGIVFIDSGRWSGGVLPSFDTFHEVEGEAQKS